MLVPKTIGEGTIGGGTIASEEIELAATLDAAVALEASEASVLALPHGAVSGSTALSGAAIVKANADAALAATGSITGTASARASARAVLSAVGALAARAVAIVKSFATVGAAGALTGAEGSSEVRPSITLTGQGSIAARAAVEHAIEGTLGASGTLNGHAAVVVPTGVVNISQALNWLIEGRATALASGRAPISGKATLTAQPIAFFNAEGDLVGIADVRAIARAVHAAGTIDVIVSKATLKVEVL